MYITALVPSLFGRCKQKQRGLRGLLCRRTCITEWEMYITAQSPRLRNDLYCVEWDVKLYYTIPYLTNSTKVRWEIMHVFRIHDFRDTCAKNYEHQFRLLQVMEENLHIFETHGILVSVQFFAGLAGSLYTQQLLHLVLTEKDLLVPKIYEYRVLMYSNFVMCALHLRRFCSRW